MIVWLDACNLTKLRYASPSRRWTKCWHIGTKGARLMPVGLRQQPEPDRPCLIAGKAQHGVKPLPGYSCQSEWAKSRTDCTKQVFWLVPVGAKHRAWQTKLNHWENPVWLKPVPCHTCVWHLSVCLGRDDAHRCMVSGCGV